MKPSFPSGHPVSKRAFTLLELLVVIAIIGILASIMYPATTAALKRADKVHAQTTIHNLKTAIATFYTDYKRYPIDTSGADEEQDIETEGTIMDALLAADNEVQSDGLNPRGTVYLAPKQAKPMGGGQFRKGVRFNEDGGGELWDPWGEYYYLRLDLDFNSRITAPDWDDSSGASFLPGSVIVWSTGSETSDDKDNVTSW